MQPLYQSIQSRMKRFEEETVEFKSTRRGRPVCWIIILAVATFVFLVLSIVFITLFALEKSKSTETSPKSPVSGQKYCGTRACLETSLGELIKFNLLVLIQSTQRSREIRFIVVNHAYTQPLFKIQNRAAFVFIEDSVTAVPIF